MTKDDKKRTTHSKFIKNSKKKKLSYFKKRRKKMINIQNRSQAVENRVQKMVLKNGVKRFLKPVKMVKKGQKWSKKIKDG